MQTITSPNSENNNIEGEHILMTLTFIAKNSEENSGMALARALEHWRRYFEESDITSALMINDNYFIHNLEGSRPAINRALAKLINEYLKVLPHVVEVEEIDERRWDGYLIKYFTSNAQYEQYALKHFSAGSDFNPYLMKKTQITGFMRAIFEDKDLTISQNDDIS